MEENQDALRLFKLQGSYRKVIGRIDIFHMAQARESESARRYPVGDTCSRSIADANQGSRIGRLTPHIVLILM